MTEALWKRRLAAAHPDRGGDARAFQALVVARETWRARQPRPCAWCQRGFVPGTNRTKAQGVQRFCQVSCSNQARHRRKVAA